MGDAAEAAKADMLASKMFHKQVCQEEGLVYPSFLDDEFEMLYKFDTQSLLEYYSGILSLSGLEKITVIHQKQLWKYLHGQATPRPVQVAKIETGLHRFGKELLSTTL